jgi:hypothetical protein
MVGYDLAPNGKFLHACVGITSMLGNLNLSHLYFLESMDGIVEQIKNAVIFTGKKFPSSR